MLCPHERGVDGAWYHCPGITLLGISSVPFRLFVIRLVPSAKFMMLLELCQATQSCVKEEHSKAMGLSWLGLLCTCWDLPVRKSKIYIRKVGQNPKSLCMCLVGLNILNTESHSNVA